MRVEPSNTSRDGFNVGDFILIGRMKPAYGRILEIYNRFGEPDDWQVRCNRVTIGEQIESEMLIDVMLNADMTERKRRSRVTITEDRATLINREIVAVMFRKLNDLVAYCRMLSEQNGEIYE